MARSQYIYHVQYLDFPMGPIRHAYFTVKHEAESYIRQHEVASREYLVERYRDHGRRREDPELPWKGEIRTDGSIHFT